MKRSLQILTKIAFCFTIALTINGCSKKDSPITPTHPVTGPTISALSVNQGPYNTSVVISGTNFSSTLADDKVFFNGKAATVTAATATQLTATVPLGAGTGNVTVSVSDGAVVSGPVFTYQLSAVVTTIAGSAGAGSTNGKGTAASFSVPYGITSDANGNLYVADKNNLLIRKIASDGTVSTLAGSGILGKADGAGPAASFSEPLNVAFGPDGNLYATDFVFNSIRKITTSGEVTTVQPVTNQTGYTTAYFTPIGIAIAANGNIYVSNTSLITELDMNGLATIFTGTDQYGIVDGGHGVAQLSSPQGMRIDQNGTIYFADANTIRKVDKDGLVTTLAGSKTAGSADGKGTAASFNRPKDIAVDKEGNIYVTDNANRLIRKLATDGTVSTVAGNISIFSSQDGVGTNAGFNSPTGICIDNNGAMYVTDHNEVRKIIFE